MLYGLDLFVKRLVIKDITAKTALLCVMRIVNTRTNYALVKQDGWVLAVKQNALALMEKTAAFHAVYTVLTKHVTDLMEDV